MKSFYTKVTAIGGRHGTVRRDDGILDLHLATPNELGGRGGATNPEQLFAAGYAACFENAVIHASRLQADKIRDDEIEVIGEVSFLPNGKGGFKLAVTLNYFRRCQARSTSCTHAPSVSAVACLH